jgi:hypothetical protein
MYKLFLIVTGPVVKAMRRVTPRQVIDRHMPLHRLRRAVLAAGSRWPGSSGCIATPTCCSAFEFLPQERRKNVASFHDRVTGRADTNQDRGFAVVLSGVSVAYFAARQGVPIPARCGHLPYRRNAVPGGCP